MFWQKLGAKVNEQVVRSSEKGTIEIFLKILKVLKSFFEVLFFKFKINENNADIFGSA